MLKVQNLGYDSWQTIYFQRASVIVTEFVLIYALHRYELHCDHVTSVDDPRFIETSPTKKTAHASALAILLSPGLLIIDHIHFQYNGFLYGILFLSIVLAQQHHLLQSGLLFAALLCFKHIYLYLAPAYFVYLLRAYCLHPRSIFRIQFANCVKLGLGIIVIFAAAFGPFAYWGQIAQLLSRLFPFSRGLCHAYWAPNVWAIYSFSDRVLLYRELNTSTYSIHKLILEKNQWLPISTSPSTAKQSPASPAASSATPPSPSSPKSRHG
jgi:alpha-1,3-glucosyltransferase